MNNQATPSMTAPGPETITVERHKTNFMSLHGTFEDKPSQNITRWLFHADAYRTAYMIHSLEMGSIIIYCIRGEPARKIRCMLDVPGTTYLHAIHYCAQLRQEEVLYQPYQAKVEYQAPVVDQVNALNNRAEVLEVLA